MNKKGFFLQKQGTLKKKNLLKYFQLCSDILYHFLVCGQNSLVKLIFDFFFISFSKQKYIGYMCKVWKSPWNCSCVKHSCFRSRSFALRSHWPWPLLDVIEKHSRTENGVHFQPCFEKLSPPGLQSIRGMLPYPPSLLSVANCRHRTMFVIKSTMCREQSTWKFFGYRLRQLRRVSTVVRLYNLHKPGWNNISYV